MMKKETIQKLLVRSAVLAFLLVCLCAHALAYDASMAESWMEQFSQALTALSPVHDSLQSADPSRAGEYLLEYEFGTIRSRVSANPGARDILQIDVRTNQVTDCRGVRVGMRLDQALEGAMPVYGASPLYVLSTQEAGYGWSWAYMGDEGAYGVEYIAYGSSDAAMTEYTLTYVIEDELITAIRMKASPATLAQAQEGLETAEEIASRQDVQALIAANEQPMITLDDLQVMGGKVLGEPVDQLIVRMGEPIDIQTLPQSAGRVLVYEGAVVTLGFNEQTGEELVRALSVCTEAFDGPNRLRVGMSVSEAGSLARCDTPIYSRGGMLYLEGEALGEAPYGELRIISADEMMLVYACEDHEDTAILQVIATGGRITSWQMMYLSDVQGGV